MNMTFFVEKDVIWFQIANRRTGVTHEDMYERVSRRWYHRIAAVPDGE